MRKEEDFEQFFKKEYTRFYFFAHQMVNDEETCRDIVSEAFGQVWEMSQTDKVLNWNSYMYTIIRNKCVNHIRHEMAKEHYADFYLRTFNEEDEDEDETREQLATIYRMMKTFTPQTRKVLKLVFFQKKTYQQAADELDVSTSAIKKHIVSALKAFREEFLKKR